MANAHSTPIVNPQSGLKVEEHCWGITYRGTEAALVAAGLVKPEWFPGKPGNAKMSVRIALVDGAMQPIPFRAMLTAKQRASKHISLRKANKHEFVAWISFSEEERERQSLRETIEKAHAQKAKRIAELPANPGDFLKRELRTIKSMMSAIRDGLTGNLGSTGGYGFSPDLLVEFDILADHLIQMVKDEPIYFNQEKRQQEVAQIELEMMAQHPEFSAFMQATLAIAKAVI